MPLVPVPDGRAIWQQVAEAYRPPNDPFSLYSQDEQQGVLHAATLAINFELFVNALPMHNAWSAGHWFGPYPLRIVDEERLALFPRLVTPEEAAEVIGYTIPPSERTVRSGALDLDGIPEWVRAYRYYLQRQVERHGRVVRRELRGDEF